MTNRLFVLFALVFALLLTGCRSSAKTSQAIPTPSPMPTAQDQKVAPATPPQPQASPGSPIPVSPPASFTAEQLNGQATQFIVHGQKGQFLRVKADWGNESMPPVSAQLVGDTPRPLKAFYENGDCSGNFVFKLPETGSYQVGFDPPSQGSGLKFNLLASDDEMVDPGIKADQISIDFGSFARGKQMKFVPFGQFKGCVDDWEPSLWALDDNRVEFRIMQVAGYKKVLEPDSSMELLETTLKNGKMTPPNKLPYPNIPDVGLNMWGRFRFLEWNGWKGITWIGAFGQDWLCTFSQQSTLAYVVQGISNDGRFFVMMRVEVSNAEVSHRLDQKCNSGPSQRNVKEFDAFFKNELSAEFDKEMSGADPASFQPSLDQLDAVIKSLKLKP